MFTLPRLGGSEPRASLIGHGTYDEVVAAVKKQPLWTVALGCVAGTLVALLLGSLVLVPVAIEYSHSPPPPPPSPPNSPPPPRAAAGPRCSTAIAAAVLAAAGAAGAASTAERAAVAELAAQATAGAVAAHDAGRGLGRAPRRRAVARGTCGCGARAGRVPARSLAAALGARALPPWRRLDGDHRVCAALHRPLLRPRPAAAVDGHVDDDALCARDDRGVRAPHRVQHDATQPFSA